MAVGELSYPWYAARSWTGRGRIPVEAVGRGAGMEATIVHLTTGTRPGTDVTPHARELASGHDDGLLHMFVPHATAGLAIFELGAGSDDDLSELLDRVFPRDGRYLHAHGSHGHGADHVLPVFVNPSLSVPV